MGSNLTIDGLCSDLKILENLDLQIHRFIVNALHVPTRMANSVDEHGEILEKIKEKGTNHLEGTEEEGITVF